MNEPRRIGLVAPTVHRVPKKCSTCKREWVGNSFKPAPADGSLVSGLCDDCITRLEQAKRTLSGPAPEAPIEPAAPRKVFGYDE